MWVSGMTILGIMAASVLRARRPRSHVDTRNDDGVVISEILLERAVFLYYKRSFNDPKGMKSKTNNCSGCSHEDSCRLMYEKIGNVKGPSVLGKAVLAFLVPIFVFIASLAAATKLLQDHLSEAALTLVSFLLAAAVTVVVIFVIRAIRRPSRLECQKTNH